MVKKRKASNKMLTNEEMVCFCNDFSKFFYSRNPIYREEAIQFVIHRFGDENCSFLEVRYQSLKNLTSLARLNFKSLLICDNSLKIQLGHSPRKYKDLALFMGIEFREFISLYKDCLTYVPKFIKFCSDFGENIIKGYPYDDAENVQFSIHMNGDTEDRKVFFEIWYLAFNLPRSILRLEYYKNRDPDYRLKIGRFSHKYNELYDFLMDHLKKLTSKYRYKEIDNLIHFPNSYYKIISINPKKNRLTKDPSYEK